MAAPTNTYNSNTDLSLGQVPQVDDEDLYTALLDIHNAIEALVTSSDAGGGRARAFKIVTGDYTVTVNDHLILTDTTAGNITVTLPKINLAVGYDYTIKQVVGSNETLIVGDSALEPVDDDTSGITIDLLEAIPVKNDGSSWWIHN